MAHIINLTVAQELTLCDILAIPYATQFYTMDGMGALSALTNVQNSTNGQAFTALNAWLLALDDAVTTVLLVRIARWDAIGSIVTNMQGGAVGRINGVTMDYKEERALLKTWIQNMVPFLVWQEVQRRLNAGNQEGVKPAGGGVSSVAMSR